MAGYNDTKNLIIEALMGRQAGTEIQPERHQAYALNMLDYVRSVELVSSSTLVGLAEESTVPVQPDQGKVCYIAGVGQDRTVTFSNFIDDEGNPITITTGEMEGVFVILLWNMEHWVAYTFNTNIISSAESANFYYGYNIRKTYASVAAMNADSVNPIGTDGRLIKIGELVTVVNSITPAGNGYYSYEGSENGWLLQSGFSFEIVQTTGTDINKAMSQKAVTDELVQVRSEQIQGGIYDVSSHNDGAVFESLLTLLGSANLSTLIPTSVRRGGMSIRFIQGSVPNPDNKYVQFRCKTQSFSVNPYDWESDEIKRLLISDAVEGNNNLFVQNSHKDIIPGHVYSLTLLTTDWSRTAATGGAAIFKISSKNSSNVETAIEQYVTGRTPYDKFVFKLPDDSVELLIGGRADVGYSIKYSVFDVSNIQLNSGSSIRITKQDIVNGLIGDVTGLPGDDDYSVLCLNFIAVNEGEIISFLNPENYKVAAFYYDENFNYNDVRVWYGSYTQLIVPSGVSFVRLGFRNQEGAIRKDEFNLIHIKVNPPCNQVTIKVNLTSDADVLPNFDTTNKKLTFSTNARVYYLGTEYTIDELQYAVYGETNFRLLVFNKITKQLSFIGYNVFDPTTQIILGNLQYSGSALNSIVMPFDYIINGANDLKTVQEKCIKQAVLKFGNNYNTLPNFNLTENKLEFPSEALIQHGTSIYTLGESYAASSYPIPTTGSALKFIVFDVISHEFSVIASNLLNVSRQVVLGWFIYSGGVVRNSDLPFQFTVNGSLLLKMTAADIPFLKYGNSQTVLPNFNFSTNKLELPATCLVQYGSASYPLDPDWGSASFDIPMDAGTSALKVLVFNKVSKVFSIKAANFVTSSESPLGWFIMNGTALGSYDLPFPSFTVDGKRLNDVSDKIEDNSWLLFKDVIALQGHFFMELIGMGSNVIYPSQTIADIHFCSRIGVKSIEANCLKTATPGKYIVMHGNSGCIGYQMLLKKEAYEANLSAYPYAQYSQSDDAYYNFDLNEPKDIFNGHIPSTSYDDLRNNYFNRSLYPKYRTPITDMEEFLKECKALDIFPIITYQDDTQIPIIESIVGKKYAFRANERHGNVLHIVWVDEKKTKEEALTICNRYGRPFMYGMGVAAAMQYTDSELQEFVDYLHSYGYFIVFNGNYYDEEKNQRLKLMNFDGQTTNWDIPKFESGNVCNLSAEIDYSEFIHNGSVSNNELTLAIGNTIEPDFTFESMFLSKAYLEIRFAGTITISMGKVTGTFVSDGSKTTVFSNVFLNSQTAPKFVITAVSETKVIDIVYRVSKC